MAPPCGCFARFANKLGLVQHQPYYTATNEHLSLEDVQHARYLATTDLRVIEEEKVKSDRTAFLIKHLPELAQYAGVFFNHKGNYWLIELWTVSVSKTLPLPEHIGGCLVYLRQPAVITTDSFISVTQPYLGMGAEGGFMNMTPAEFLADETDLCGLVQATFPSSIGLRLHPWHYIDILYPSRRVLEKEANDMIRHWTFPPQVCYMMFDLKVWDDKVKLPGTMMVHFDPERKMNIMEWLLKARQYHRDMDEKATKE